MPNEMSWPDFSNRYSESDAENGVEIVEHLRSVLSQQKETYNPVGWMLLRCVDMWSSRGGRCVVLPYGPNNTLKEPPTQPFSPRGMASDMSVVEGVLLAEALPA